jgi:hypothetical protein
MGRRLHQHHHGPAVINFLRLGLLALRDRVIFGVYVLEKSGKFCVVWPFLSDYFSRVVASSSGLIVERVVARSAKGHGWQRIIVFCRNFKLGSRLFTKYINFSFLFSIKSALLIVFIHVISIRIAVCFVVQAQICLYNQHIIHLSTIHTTSIFGFFLIKPSAFMC